MYTFREGSCRKYRHFDPFLTLPGKKVQRFIGDEHRGDLMTQKCSICKHPKATEINRALIKGDSIRDIALQYNVGHMSLHRHQKAGHIPATIAKFEEAKKIAQGEDLLRYTKALLGRTISYMNQAESAGDLRTAISAVREARGCVELLGKVTGELCTNAQTAIQVNTTVKPVEPPRIELPPEALKAIGDLLAKHYPAASPKYGIIEDTSEY